MTCELQVRTLTEETWGEVDHKINYPHKTKSVACLQQIRALARSTSAAGRLVDAIFATIAHETAIDREKQLSSEAEYTSLDSKSDAGGES